MKRWHITAVYGAEFFVSNLDTFAQDKEEAHSFMHRCLCECGMDEDAVTTAMIYAVDIDSKLYNEFVTEDIVSRVKSEWKHDHFITF